MVAFLSRRCCPLGEHLAIQDHSIEEKGDSNSEKNLCFSGDYFDVIQPHVLLLVRPVNLLGRRKLPHQKTNKLLEIFFVDDNERGECPLRCTIIEGI